MKKLLLVCVFVRVSLFFCSHGETIDPSEIEDEHEFFYEEETGKGPKSWGDIKPEWEICKKGDLQSPIDLHHARVKLIHQYGRLNKNYKPAHAAAKNRGHDIMVMTVSREQVHDLKTAVHGGFEYNARPLQKSNNRPVFLFTPVKKEN